MTHRLSKPAKKKVVRRRKPAPVAAAMTMERDEELRVLKANLDCDVDGRRRPLQRSASTLRGYRAASER